MIYKIDSYKSNKDRKTPLRTLQELQLPFKLLNNKRVILSQLGMNGIQRIIKVLSDRF